MSRPLRAAAAAAALLLAPVAAPAPVAQAGVLDSACTISWSGAAGDGAWSNAGNWTASETTVARVPAAGDDVCIAPSEGPAPVLGEPAIVRTLSIAGNDVGGTATLSLAAGAGASAVTLTTEPGAERLTVGPGGRLVLDAASGARSAVHGGGIANDGAIILRGAGDNTIAAPLANRLGTLRLEGERSRLRADVVNEGTVEQRGSGTASVEAAATVAQAGTWSTEGRLVVADGTLRIAGGVLQPLPGGDIVIGGAGAGAPRLVYAPGGSSAVTVRAGTIAGDVPAGHTLTVGGSATLDGPVTNAGTIRGTGTLVGTLTNAATVEPVGADGAAGVLEVTGDYSQTPGGTLAARVDSPAAASQLRVGGAAALDGAVAVTLGPDGAPSACGGTRDLLSAAQVTGAWSSATGAWGATGRFLAVRGATSAGVKAIDVPGKPRDVTVAAGSERVVLGITSPGHSGCDAVSGYVVRLHPQGVDGSGSDIVKVVERASDATVTGLVNQQVYEITARARNHAGLGAGTTVAAKPNGAPAAGFTVAPAAPRAGDVVSFASTSADTDTATEPAAEWDLDGDGTFEATGSTVARTYASAGSVTVRLRATDADGAQATAEREIVVAAEPAPSPTASPTPEASPVPNATPAADPPGSSGSEAPPAADPAATAEPTPEPEEGVGRQALDAHDPGVTAVVGAKGIRRTAAGVVPVPVKNVNPFPVRAVGLLRTRGAKASAAPSVTAAKPRLLGFRRAVIPARGEATLEFKLSKAGRRLLARSRRLRATLVLRLAGPVGAPVTVDVPVKLRTRRPR